LPWTYRQFRPGRSFRSRRGIERTLFRLTIVLAVLFVAFSLLNLYRPPGT